MKNNWPHYVFIAVLACAVGFYWSEARDLKRDQQATLDLLERSQIEFAAADLAHKVVEFKNATGRYPVDVSENDVWVVRPEMTTLGIRSIKDNWAHWIHVNPMSHLAYSSYIRCGIVGGAYTVSAVNNGQVVYEVKLGT